jgi:hypothetical protein
MKRELVLAGKALGGASLTGAVLYLVATVPTHVHIYWPYWIFLGGLVAGVALYFAGQERTGSADQAVAPPSDEVPELVGSAITDRWQSNLNQVSSEMLLLQNNSMSHPGYSSRPMTDTPPSVRIGLQVACAQLDPGASSSVLRAKILQFLGQSAVMDLVRELTEIRRDAVWTARDDNPPFNFGAVLAVPGTEEAPVAWARVLLPETMTRMYGRDARSAYMVLYAEPRTTFGSPAEAASLASWHQHLSAALKVPGAFAGLLDDDLGLPATNDPPAAVSIWLKAPRALTELVEVENFDVVAGSPQSNWFMGVAIASPEGVQSPDLIQAWLRQMCDSSLHLDNYEVDIASLNGSGTGPRLAVRVVSTEWVALRDDVLIAAIQVELANATDSPVRIASVDLRSETDTWDSLRSVTIRDPALDSTLTASRTDRFEPELASYRSVPAHGSVSGWVSISIFAWTDEGTPELEFTVREAVGTTNLTVIPRTDRQVSSA